MLINVCSLLKVDVRFFYARLACTEDVSKELLHIPKGRREVMRFLRRAVGGSLRQFRTKCGAALC